MKRIVVVALLCIASLLILGGLGLARTVAVKKSDRSVFVSAQVLAVSCRAMKDAVGYDNLLGSQGSNRPPKTTGDMAAVGRCTGYIEGVADEFRESMGSHYHPVRAPRGELPMVIEAFLKRVDEHPEEADFAASTVLHEADNDLLRSCGDCGIGLLVRPPRY
jgi:Rap1a immunity proteins